MPATSARILLCCAFLTAVLSSAGCADDSSEAASLVEQLGQFPAAIDPRIQGNSGQPTSTEQKRKALYVKLRTLGRAAVPALQHGLMDTDVQIRRNVALYLGEEGGNYAKRAPAPLDLKPFLPQLVKALRDQDQRVKELAAQALEHTGPEAAIAVPDLIRLLEDPAEGLRNSACIGLAGIGPAAHEALPALRRALADRSNDVRRFAQRAIDRIEAKSSKLNSLAPNVRRRYEGRRISTPAADQ
jgi:HEAT repeat protein